MELNLPIFQVEIAIENFLISGNFQPRGDAMVFMNDQSRTHIRVDDVELKTLTSDYQIPGFKQSYMSLDRDAIHFISIIDQEQSELLQVLRTKRPVVFYTDWCAIRGDLHVNRDLREDDLFDRGHDYFAISNASVFTTKGVTKLPTRNVNYVLVNRRKVLAYHTYQPDEG